MWNRRRWLGVTVAVLVGACGSDADEALRSDAAADTIGAKDSPVADVVSDQGRDMPVLPDLALMDLVADVPGVEVERQDAATPLDALVPDAFDAGREVGPIDAGKPLDVQGRDSRYDVPTDTLGYDVTPPSYICRDDADCCVVVDRCMAKAYLYSKAPGASPAPPIPYVSDPGKCLRCMSPAVQVRCDNGRCAGRTLSGYSGTILSQDHCGTIVLSDGGAEAYYTPAFAGDEQISWGC